MTLACALALGMGTLGACTGRCPELEPVELRSGTYDGMAYDRRSSGEIVSTDKQIVIDRQSGTATIRFEREGRQVVEVWKLGPPIQ